MPLTLDRSDLETFRVLVARRLGLAFEDGKLDYLADVLRSRLEASGGGSASAYLGRLSGFEGREEWRVLAEKLTVSETFFFRYWDHFRAFVDRVLPAHASPESGEIRILSAGCASGEEAYSLAILIRERLQQSTNAPPVTILGIDINPAVLEKARRGRYAGWSLRETTPDLRDRYFKAEGREFVLSPEIRSMVTFEERNLTQPDPSFWRPNAFDVVFCRNVTMYFSNEGSRAVIDRIAQALVPGGHLFLGHAETLRGLSEGFHLRHTHETFYYQRRGRGESPGPSSSRSTLGASPPPPPAGLLDLNDSWVDVIQRASDRIAFLADGAGRPPQGSAPAAVPEPPPARRTCDLGIILELLRKERFSDALKLLSALPAESRTDPDAQLLRAVILTNRGDLEKAKETCAQILDADDLHAGAHYLMALCLEHEGDPTAAMEHDQTAVYLDPAFAMPRFHLGLLAKRQGSTELARSELGQALTLLGREDSSRILLFGGGFSRDALVELCREELRRCGGGA